MGGEIDRIPVEVVANLHCPIGEGPLWHATEERLYWVDIGTGRMFRYDPRSGTHETFYHGQQVGGFTIQADGSLLLFMAHGTIKVWKHGGRAAGEVVVVKADGTQKERGSRFNDVIADPLGRVYCGTMPTEKSPGRLYRLDTDGTLTELLSARKMIPNGLGFTNDNQGLYFVDSDARTVYLFDYDKASGDLSNQRVFCKVTSGEGLPDGLTVDDEDQVWVALCRGGALVRYTPTGELNGRIEFPASKVTSMTFGGPDLSEMYVTSGGTRGRDGPAAGALFRLKPETRGVPEFTSRVLM